RRPETVVQGVGLRSVRPPRPGRFAAPAKPQTGCRSDRPEACVFSVACRRSRRWSAIMLASSATSRRLPGTRVNYRSRLVAMILPAAMYLTSLIVPVVDPFVSPYSSPQSGATAFQIGWRYMYLYDETGWPVDRIELVAAWWANPAIWA